MTVRADGGVVDNFCALYFFHSDLFRLTDEESRKNWEEYGNPDGPTGKQFKNLDHYSPYINI